MKSKILGLLAVGLLALPVIGYAVPVTYHYVGSDLSIVSTGLPTGLTRVTATFTADLPANTVDFQSLSDWSFSDGVTTLTSASLLLGYSLFALFETDAVGNVTGFLIEIGKPNPLYVEGEHTRLVILWGGFGDYAETYYVVSGRFGSTSIRGTSSPGSLRFGTVAVPEPGTLALLGLGLAGLGLSRRRKAN